MSGISPKLLRALAEMGSRTPKVHSRVIFMGRVGGSLIDNVKYAFLDCVRHFPQLDCHFLTHDARQKTLLERHNLPALLFPESDSVQICATAGVVVCDDFWWRSRSPVHLLLQGARVLQLWHGIPLKSIGIPEAESSVNMDPEKAASLRENYSGYDAVLSTSPFFTEQAFARAFRADDFPELGYPRNDALLRPLDKYDMINVEAELFGELRSHRNKGGRVVFYMPTFRDAGGDPFTDRAISPQKLQEFAVANNILFVCKFHPYEDCSISSNLPNLRICRSDSDPYPLLRLADALVTDYSSIYFDYLLLDRPIVYFQYDHEEYVTRSRELMLDMDAVTPGPILSNEDDLYAVLADTLGGNDQYADERQALKNLSFAHHDAGAGRRVSEYVLERFVKPAGRRVSPPREARRAMA